MAPNKEAMNLEALKHIFCSGIAPHVDSYSFQKDMWQIRFHPPSPPPTAACAISYGDNKKVFLLLCCAYLKSKVITSP